MSARSLDSHADRVRAESRVLAAGRERIGDQPLARRALQLQLPPPDYHCGSPAVEAHLSLAELIAAALDPCELVLPGQVERLVHSTLAVLHAKWSKLDDKLAFPDAGYEVAGSVAVAVEDCRLVSLHNFDHLRALLGWLFSVAVAPVPAAGKRQRAKRGAEDQRQPL